MVIRSYFLLQKGAFYILLIALSGNLLKAQQTPLYPISQRLLTPFMINPAIAGSKDFFSIDLLTSNYNNDRSQLLNLNLRLSKTGPGYLSSRRAPQFSNFGLGVGIFNDLNGPTRNIGIIGAGSYHFNMDKEGLSFLSLGLSLKLVNSRYEGNHAIANSEESTVFPDFDAGIYYYNRSFFTGFSITNLIGSYQDAYNLEDYTIPSSRQLFYQIGFKAVVNKSLKIILEPSLYVNYSDTISTEWNQMLEPALKLYISNLCIGTYFYDFDHFSFFFQYKFPRFYLGTYFEVPKDTPFYKNPVRAEFAIGLNISSIKSGSLIFNHW
jgi:type IX secretion system PorP/SprF family membrane protein